MAVSSKCFICCKILIFFIHRHKESNIWNDLLSKVQTPYVYVGQDLHAVTQEVRLNMLIDKLVVTGAVVVGSFVKTLTASQVLY